jgi:type IV secretory pathway TraG/TraD family ATPase VirD4
MWWDGPVVSTSTRGDVVAFVGDRRRALAASAGGRVHVYDPFGSEYPGRSLHWSPLAGCAEPAVCYRRVAAMTAVAGSSMTDGDHWRAGAAGLLRGYFHAAALAGLPLAAVRRWLAAQDTRDGIAILRSSDSPGAMWADDLEASRLLGDRERGSFYSVARNTLEATAEPTVLASCETTDLDIDEFLTSRSTLFVIGPSHQQQVVAPLIAGLIDSIATRGAERAAAMGSRLDPPLLLALDEVANIAPLATLPSLVSEGGGRGIVTMWVAQSLAQMRMRYGEEQQAAILATTTAKIIFGGLSNARDLVDISSWAGRRRQATTSFQVGSPQSTRDRGRVSIAGGAVTGPMTVSSHDEPALPVDAIQMLPPFLAWLFWRSDPPRQVLARPAGTIEDLARLSGFSP